MSCDELHSVSEVVLFVCKLKPKVEILHNREILGGIAIRRIHNRNDMVYCRLIGHSQ